MKTKVHMVVLLVIDHDDLGADEVKSEIESVRYANDCLSPNVMDIDTREVDWEDDHPLNFTDGRRREAFLNLFDLVDGE